MSTELLRPSAVTLNGWTGQLSYVLDTIGVPNTADFIQSPTFVLEDLDYFAPVIFTFPVPAETIVDVLRIRTVIQRTGIVGDLTYQARIILEVLPLNGVTVTEYKTLAITRTIPASTTTSHEVVDVFTVDTSLYQSINDVKVEYRLSPSGIYDSVTGEAEATVMSADQATLKLISVALEADSFTYTSPPSPPVNLNNYFRWDVSPSFMMSSDNAKEIILPQSFSPRTQGFTGTIRSLQDSPGFFDYHPTAGSDSLSLAPPVTNTSNIGAVRAYYSGSSITPVLVLNLPVPQLPYDADGFLNIRWNGEAAPAQFAVTLYAYAENGDKLWLGTSLETLDFTADRPFYSTSIAIPLPIDTITGLEVEISAYDVQPGDLLLVGVSSVVYAMAGFAPNFISPPAPLLPPSEFSSPPLPPGTSELFELPGTPPIVSPPTAFVPTYSGGECFLSPPPPGGVYESPLPPGSELLRPNRDIRNMLFNPRPLWLQLNDPVGESCSYVTAPAEVDVYDEETGDRLRSYRAQFEIGFTQPQQEGPWQSLQLRFQAARSRPPVNENFVTIDSCEEVVTGTCPPPQRLIPNRTFSGHSWLPGPAHWTLDESPYSPDGCFVVHPIAEPSTLSLGFSTPDIDLTAIDGWTEFQVTVRARIRALGFAKTARIVSKIGGNTLSFTGMTGFHVRFEPLNCEGKVTAFLTSPTRIEGMAVFRSNIDTEVTLKLMTPHHTVVPLLSLDGISYGVEHRISLQSLVQKMVYYSIEINQNGNTPVGQYGIGLAMALDGASYVTADTLFLDGIVFDVTSQALAAESALSVVRLKANLDGEQFFGERWQRSNLLRKNWIDYTFSFVGRPYAIHSIHDLKVLLETEVLYQADEKTVVDVDVISLTATPYCANFVDLPEEDESACELTLIPSEDVANTGWTSSPLSPKLVSLPVKAERSIYVETNTLTTNSFTVAMDFEDTPSTDLSARSFDELVIQVTARAYDSYQSLSTELEVQTNYSAAQRITTSNSWQVYELVWTFDPAQAYDLFTNKKLRVSMQALSIGSLNVAARVQVAAIRAFVRCADTDEVASSVLALNPDSGGGIPITTNSPTGPLPALSNVCTLTAVPSTVEVFSCGSNGNCGSQPETPAFSFSVTNTSTSDGLVQIDVFGNIAYWITPSVVEVVSAGEIETFAVYLAVGSVHDAYPREPETGLVRIVVSCPGQEDESRIVRWYYRGVD